MPIHKKSVCFTFVLSVPFCCNEVLYNIENLINDEELARRNRLLRGMTTVIDSITAFTEAEGSQGDAHSSQGLEVAPTLAGVRPTIVGH
jgi:hypothetical protein